MNYTQGCLIQDFLFSFFFSSFSKKRPCPVWPSLRASWCIAKRWGRRKRNRTCAPGGNEWPAICSIQTLYVAWPVTWRVTSLHHWRAENDKAPTWFLQHGAWGNKQGGEVHVARSPLQCECWVSVREPSVSRATDLGFRWTRLCNNLHLYNDIHVRVCENLCARVSHCMYANMCECV